MIAIITLLASFIGVFAFVKYIILLEIRVDASVYKYLYELATKNKHICISTEYKIEGFPITFKAFCFIKGCPWFYLNHSERLLTAGFQGKDSISSIVVFRWNAKKFKSFLLKHIASAIEVEVPVEIILPHYTDKIGSIKHPIFSLHNEKHEYQEIEEDINSVLEGKKYKTGAILYGNPGCGKTSFVKYIATKYKLPIRIVNLNPDYTNYDIMSIFSNITSKSIVLFEDFDNYFNKRECLMAKGNQHIKFTFDAILNGLDGVYNSYEKVIFLMTVNDIDKVDDALRLRPSRFKFVKKFNAPSEEKIKSIVGFYDNRFAGLNLDQILLAKDLLSIGKDMSEIIPLFSKKEDTVIKKATTLNNQFYTIYDNN